MSAPYYEFTSEQISPIQKDQNYLLSNANCKVQGSLVGT